MRATSRIRARDGWLIALAVAGVIAVSIAARSGPVPVNEAHSSRIAIPKTPHVDLFTQSDSLARGHPSHWHLPLHFLWGLIRLLGLIGLALLVLLVVAMVITLVPRIKLRKRRTVVVEPVQFASADSSLGSEVSATFAAALAGLRRGDRERAIIECWLRLEQLAESAGYPARAWQTSSEQVSWWLSVLPLPERELAELAELYREARYSNHRMTEQAVDRARGALALLRAGLAERIAEDV
ncbi:MAG: DUF4129 domain-containing protein [Jatrophihabitantaceae bacterium]